MEQGDEPRPLRPRLIPSASQRAHAKKESGYVRALLRFNFILPLVEKTRGIFDLRYVLTDKAYRSETVVGRLCQMGMRARHPHQETS